MDFYPVDAAIEKLPGFNSSFRGCRDLAVSKQHVAQDLQSAVRRHCISCKQRFARGPDSRARYPDTTRSRKARVLAHGEPTKTLVNLGCRRPGSFRCVRGRRHQRGPASPGSRRSLLRRARALPIRSVLEHLQARQSQRQNRDTDDRLRNVDHRRLLFDPATRRILATGRRFPNSGHRQRGLAQRQRIACRLLLGAFRLRSHFEIGPLTPNRSTNFTRRVA
jgi:hypothetical protein